MNGCSMRLGRYLVGGLVGYKINVKSERYHDQKIEKHFVVGKLKQRPTEERI